MENVHTAGQPRSMSAIILLLTLLWSGPKQGQVSLVCNVICAWGVAPWNCMRQKGHQVCLGRARPFWIRCPRAAIGKRWIEENGLGHDVRDRFVYEASTYFTGVRTMTGITRLVLRRYSSKPGITSTILSYRRVRSGSSATVARA